MRDVLAGAAFLALFTLAVICVGTACLCIYAFILGFVIGQASLVTVLAGAVGAPMLFVVASGAMRLIIDRV